MPQRRTMSAAPGTAMPSGRGVAAPSFPIAVVPSQGAIAPVPINDRFPLVVGPHLTVSYLASTFRLASTGYRLQYVDLLNELLEQDPHLFSVVSKRVLSSAVGRIEIVPVKIDEDDPDYDLAQELAELVQREIDRIPNLTGHLSSLLWAVYYGLSACEIFWTHDADGWHIDRLGFVHSRRLAYPDYQSWDLYVWDQGQVYGWSSPWGSSPTNASVFGARVADYPGKFIVHTPQLRGDYPTRDGIGRQVATWAMFKRVGARGAIEYLERFSKPIMDVAYATQNDGRPREATEEDIALAAAIARTIGAGSGSYGAHADSVVINPKNPSGESASKLTWPEWISLCNGEMSKAALGGTLGTDVGKGGGNRALGEVQERGEVDLEKYDGINVAETTRRDLCTWIVRLNRPDALHLVPHVKLHIDPDPDPKAILALAKELTAIGAPVDLDATADEVGVALVPNDTGKPRQSIKSDLAALTKTLTQIDYPIDLDKLAPMTGIPIVEADDLENARRSRLVTGGKDMPVEPDGSNDPNDPNAPEPPLAPEGAPPGESGGESDEWKGAQAKTPTPKTAKPKTPPPPRSSARGKAPGKNAAKATKAEASNRTLRAALWLMGDRADATPARQVFDQLLDDYPKSTLSWVLAAHWTGPAEVPLSDIDFASRAQWRASHEDVTPYVERIDKGRLKPVILVRRPGKTKLMIVDGHHRTLACEKLGRPVLAYIATVHTAEGPWDELHAAQRKGSSKGSYRGASYLPSYVTA